MSKLAKKFASLIVVSTMIVSSFCLSVSAANHAPGCPGGQPECIQTPQSALNTYGSHTVYVNNRWVDCKITYYNNRCYYMCPACGAIVGESSYRVCSDHSICGFFWC